MYVINVYVQNNLIYYVILKNEKNNIINNFIHQNIYALIEPLDKSMFYDINYEDKNDYVLITH